MKDKLILFPHKGLSTTPPHSFDVWDVYHGEVKRENLLFTTKNEELARKVVEGYNKINEEKK